MKKYQVILVGLIFVAGLAMCATFFFVWLRFEVAPLSPASYERASTYFHAWLAVFLASVLSVILVAGRMIKLRRNLRDKQSGGEYAA
jgi:membrane protein implicated in regulation of membrane protease activity